MAADRDIDRGERLQELIDVQGWSVSHLAREVSRNPSTVYRWLSGAAIGSESVGELSRVLGVTRDYIAVGKTVGGAPAPFSSSNGPG